MLLGRPRGRHLDSLGGGPESLHGHSVFQCACAVRLGEVFGGIIAHLGGRFGGLYVLLGAS